MTSPRVAAIAALFFVFISGAAAQNLSRDRIETSAIDAEIRKFLVTEVESHFGAIETMNPPPVRVNGAVTTGDFTWGSFMRVIAAESEAGGRRVIAGRDVSRWIAEMGLVEARKGGKSFSQLYAAEALRHFGTDLNANAVWQSMTESERGEWTTLLDAGRIYDPVKRQVINLPENYLGVAARIAAYSYEFGLLKDRAFLDSLIERAALQFMSGEQYADDDLPNGRFDRYSNEYARFCWKAAEVAGRQDILAALRPSLKEQMRLWFDLVSVRGYGYNWGRSQGLVSYLDTLEIVAFLGENPEFRPAPMDELAALYNQAWRWIRASYIDSRHTFDIFEFGRGNYSYINPQREFRQISTSLAKIIVSHKSFSATLRRERIGDFPGVPNLPDVARFVFFKRGKEKSSGVWLVRQGALAFALPVTTGTKPAIADYLAAPFGLAGFAAPVEEVYPALVPFLELADGATYAASEGADLIEPSADGRSLRLVWSNWGKVGAKSGERFRTGITAEVVFRISGHGLIRTETLKADRDVTIRNWRVAFPSTAAKSRIEYSGGRRTDILEGEEGALRITVSGDWKIATAVNASGNDRIGKGVLRPIPLHLVYSAGEIVIKKGLPRRWRIIIELGKQRT